MTQPAAARVAARMIASCQDLPHRPLLRHCTETMTGDFRVCQTDYQAPGPGNERVWLNVYSPSRRSPPASSKVTRRAIILFVGADFANVIDSWKATLPAPE